MIGILGGMGTQAGLDLCNKLAMLYRGKSDQEYPKFILYNKSDTPRRPENLKKYYNILNELLKGCRLLQKNKCKFIVMPCNTAHYWYDDLKKKIKIPILSMPEEAYLYTKKNCKPDSKIGLLSTEATIKTKVYNKYFNNNFYLVHPSRTIQKKYVNKAIKLVTQKVNSFEITYKQKWMEMMRNKLGLFSEEKNDNLLFLDLLTWMHQNKADYTNTFCHLMDPRSYNEPIYKDVYFEDWKKNLKIRQSKNNDSYENSIKLMKNNNPLIIPRNHKVEEVLALAERNDFKLLTKFLKILTKPYTKQEDTSDFQSLLGSSENYKTFCGT